MRRHREPQVRETDAKSTTSHDRGGVNAREGWPRIVVVASGKGGVGKTTLATNLAVTLSSFGQRVALVDACYALGDVATLLSLDPDCGLDDLLRGKRTLNEVLVSGPAGILVLSSPSGSSDLAELTNEQESRLWQAMKELGSTAEMVVVDATAGIGSSLQSWLHRADDLVVVTTADPAALIDAYALIKLATRLGAAARVHVIANDVSGEEEGVAVQERLGLAAREFLGIDIEPLAVIPHDAGVTAAARSSLPFVITSPKCGATRGIRRAARRILCQTGAGTGRSEVAARVPVATAAR